MGTRSRIPFPDELTAAALDQARRDPASRAPASIGAWEFSALSAWLIDGPGIGKDGGMMLNHLNLVTDEIDATQAFYETQFGFRLLFEEMGERFLGDDDGFLLAISSVDSPADPPEWLHFGFCVDSADEVERRYEQMTADGVEIAEDFFAIPGKFVAFYVRDPGGHKVEVSWNNLG